MIGFGLNKAKRHFTEQLSKRFNARESKQLMRILLEDLLDIDVKRELLHPEMRIEESQYAALQEAVGKLLDGMPIQYVTGIAQFDDLKLHVDSSVLIPRPETEELLLHAANDIPHHSPLRVWDVGTGSGCIAIALAKRRPRTEVFAFDVDEYALALAKQNAEHHQVNVNFILDDVMAPSSDLWHQPVDLVVSNPPYVREAERSTMEPNVLDYEPGLALFVPDDDPLRFYRQILTLARPQLTPHGIVWFEINEALGNEILQLCHSMGLEASILLDFASKPRFCRVKNN